MIISELKKAFTSIKFKFSILFLIVISIVQSIDSIINSGFEKLYGHPNPAFISLLSNNNNIKYLLILLWIMPIVLIFSYSNNYNLERKKGINNVYLTKTNRKKFVLCKIIVSFMSAFTLFLLPLAINLVINIIFLHTGNGFFSLEKYSMDVIGEHLYNSIRQPYIAYLRYMLLASVVIGFLGVFCQCICIILKDTKLPYIVTFAVWILFFSGTRFTVGPAFVPFTVEYTFGDSISSTIWFSAVAAVAVIICFIEFTVKKDEL